MITILEVLIIAMMPAMVALMVAVHAWAPMHAKTLSLTSYLHEPSRRGDLAPYTSAS